MSSFMLDPILRRAASALWSAVLMKEESGNKMGEEPFLSMA
jgi:hypothetical protein